MIVQLPPDFAERLAPELARAGRREIGGVLVGEHIAEETFRVADFSVQRSGGAVACFVRHPAKHRRFLARFFARTGSDFERFNYLGEWHSHPSFEAHPSGTDLAQMQAIVEDGEQAPHFAVLVIARLAFEGRIELSALAFTPFARPTPVDVHIVDRPANDPAAPVRRRSAIGTVVDSVLYWFRRAPAPRGIA